MRNQGNFSSQMKCAFPINCRPTSRGQPDVLYIGLIVYVLALLVSPVTLAASNLTDTPKALLNVTIRQTEGKNPGEISGTMAVRRPSSETTKASCFYVPYADPAHDPKSEISRRYDLIPQKFSSVGLSGGSSTLKAAPGTILQQLRPYLYRISVTEQGADIQLAFDATVPRLPHADDREWYFDGFAPVLLRSCPAEKTGPENFEVEPSLEYDVTIAAPSGWILSAPGKRLGPDHYGIRGREYVFNLSKDLRTTSFNVSGVEVEFYYRNDDFLQLLPTVQQSIMSHSRWFGPLPYERLVIVETTDLQRSAQAGIIAFNRPKQSLFKALESQWLNWRHWVIANLLAAQWYGASIGTASPDDAWLLVGIADFATLEVLETMSLRANLFNSYESGQQLLQFSYLQMQSLTAALLSRAAPMAVLTTTDIRTSQPATEQHSLLFVRQSFALRQLKALAGDSSFSTFMRNFTQTHLGTSIKPRDFYQALAAQPSPFPSNRKEMLIRNLNGWWTKEGWPDLHLKGFYAERSAGGKWLAKVEVAQLGEMEVPPLVSVTDKSGQVYFARVEKPDADGIWRASIVTEDEPATAEADPAREIFDSDRFNNRSDLSGVKFFPGNAHTLEDDAYTVFWLPYPFRRPGEAVSVGITASIFRYLQSSLNIRLEASPSDRKAGFLVKKDYRVPSHALSGSFSAAQSYEGFRVLEAAIDRNPVWKLPTPLTLGLRARHRQIVGQPDSPHVTAAIASEISTGNLWNPCRAALSGEDEEAPRYLSSGFRYSRRSAVLESQCNSKSGVDAFVRFFYGQLVHEDAPDLVFFQPEDLREARIRLDIKELSRVERIASTSNDLLLPLVIPFPGNTMVLSRGVKLRFFFDAGRAINEDINYRAAGTGLLLPFGGDLAGVGSFALTRMSFLAVLYSAAGEEESRKPRLLFDISGDL